MKLKYTIKYIKDIVDSFFSNFIYSKPKVLSSEETVAYIIEKKVNISRYGDGELRLMRGIDLEFQKCSKDLAKKLKSVKTTKNNLVCIPDIFEDDRFNLNKITNEEYFYWKKFKKYRGGLFKKYFSKNPIVGDAFISRFYLRYKNKNQIGKYIETLKRIWNGRDVLIVEGETSQVGVGNDIFDNVRSISRIICPKINAFNFYESIKNAIKRNYKDGDIVIIALGPTATVLAYDLSVMNIWALDMGHFDIEYEWFLLGTDKKVAVKNKHVSECNSLGETNNSKEYLEQIKEKIIC